jgi:hypothetical protein
MRTTDDMIKHVFGGNGVASIAEMFKTSLHGPGCRARACVLQIVAKNVAVFERELYRIESASTPGFEGQSRAHRIPQIVGIDEFESLQGDGGSGLIPR